MATHKPLGGRLVTLPFLVFSALAAVGFWFIAERFLHGIGSISNLNGGYPWGIWVVVDVVIGTAFGCGGFAMALLVYIFNKSQYHPLMRSALLGGLFGYTLGGMAVIIDLGRYWNAWHMVMPWYMQPNSVMLEVGLCVMAYVTVLWIEFSPAFMERFGLHGLKERLKKHMWIFVAVGVLLPTMHQSSLGSMVLVKVGQLSALWYTELLPLLFLMSALCMGYAVVIFEATLVNTAFGLASEQRLLSKLSAVVAGILGGFIVLRLGTVILNGNMLLAFAGDLKAWMFFIENVLFATAFVILAKPSLRTSQRSLFVAAVAMLAAGSLYRIDAYLIGMDPGNGWTYFPSVPELMVTIGVISLEIVLYLVFIKKLPVVHGHGAGAAY